jgi:hypothetical protein
MYVNKKLIESYFIQWGYRVRSFKRVAEEIEEDLVTQKNDNSLSEYIKDYLEYVEDFR